MKDIFVSYRRSDASDVTGRIFDRMKARFGEECLFKDVDSIPLGTDFRTVIAEAVSQCKVLLAVIGDDWLDVTDENGRRRIDDTNDFVRIEISTALDRKIPVVPILVENASMPKSDALPESLKNLVFRNAAQVRADPDFHNDMDRLCEQLATYVEPQRYDRSGMLPWTLGGLCFTALIVLAFFYSPWSGDRSVETNPSAETNVVSPETESFEIRYYIKSLPAVKGANGEQLIGFAVAMWREVTDIRATRVQAEGLANVIVVADEDALVDCEIGPPVGEMKLKMRFGLQYQNREWPSDIFIKAAGRNFGHALGLSSTQTPGQLMSQETSLDDLPSQPQNEDRVRVIEIWGRRSEPE
ncbi:MAG: hypothetical protein ACI9HK_002552 [Pirellulaceae bacterium]|jgi:hypothetical protein